MPNRPSTKSRIGVALAIAVAVGAFVYALQSRHPEIVAYDWTYHWRAARAVLDGLNPYLVVVPSGPYPFAFYWFYPLPSVFMALPTAPLPAVWSSAVTVGATSGLLAFAVSRENFSRLPIFLSAQFMMGAAAGSAPAILLTAVIAWPALQWLVVMKPNLGWPRLRRVQPGARCGVRLSCARRHSRCCRRGPCSGSGSSSP